MNGDKFMPGRSRKQKKDRKAKEEKTRKAQQQQDESNDQEKEEHAPDERQLKKRKRSESELLEAAVPQF